jgi:hypothetical protein
MISVSCSMQTFRKALTILCFFSLFGILSCSKKDDTVDPETTPPTTETAGFFTKIDGKDFRPDRFYSRVVVPGNDGYYAIYGLDSKTGDAVMIALPYAALVGTHTLSYVNFGSLSPGDGSDSYSTRVEPGTGTIKITDMTKTEVEGTFSFTAYSSKGTKRTLTEGKFRVPFQ